MDSFFIEKVSFVIRDAEEKRHRNGVNALQLDPSNGKLYSAGELNYNILHVYNKIIIKLTS